MNGLFSAVGQGLSSAGYGAGEVYAKGALADQQNDLAMKRDANLSDLELQRQMRMKEFEDTLKNAPLNRLSAKAKSLADEDVPQEGKPVTSLKGDVGLVPFGDDSYAPEASVGLQGDVNALRAQITNSKTMSQADKDAALAQLTNQVNAENTRAQASVAGQTRKRTPGEAMNAAVQDAGVNDMPAFAAYENQIGKPLRDERRLDIQDRREDNRAAREDNRANLAVQAEDRKERQFAQQAEYQLRRLDLMQGNQDAQNKRIDGVIDHWGRRDDAAEEKAQNGSPDRLTTTINAMNNTVRNLDDNKPSKSAPDAEKLDWTTQRMNAVAVRARAMERLNNNLTGVTTPTGNPGSSTPTTQMPGLPQGSRQVGTSGGKPVYEAPDGSRYIGQ